MYSLLFIFSEYENLTSQFFMLYIYIICIFTTEGKLFFPLVYPDVKNVVTISLLNRKMINNVIRYILDFNKNEKRRRLGFICSGQRYVVQEVPGLIETGYTTVSTHQWELLVTLDSENS